MRPKSFWILTVWLAFGAGAHPQSLLPPGTVFPISLDHTLDTRKVHAGQEVRFQVMQDIPHSHVKRRAHVVGHIMSVGRSGGGAVEMALRVDAIEFHGKQTPFTASLRALASWIEVQQAMIPEESMDRGITPEVATTTQIGGEQVYRGGGPVASGIQAVGIPAPYGALGRPRPNPERGCSGALGGDEPQALWLFSTDACGVYGFPDIQIAHAGRTNPVGTIVLKSDSGRVHLPSGTGMLLRVQQPR